MSSKGVGGVGGLSSIINTIMEEKIIHTSPSIPPGSYAKALTDAQFSSPVVQAKALSAAYSTVPGFTGEGALGGSLSPCRLQETLVHAEALSVTVGIGCTRKGSLCCP